MDQNQSVNNDLQKAIDDITNTTNIDPVFSDPVAAPSSIPEGDTGKLGEPIGPFPEEPHVQMVAPAPEPIAPLQSADIPELNIDSIMPDPERPPVVTTITSETALSTPLQSTTANTSNTQQIKQAILRDLAPILDRTSMSPSQKFKVYRDIFENLQDYTVLEPAYKVAKELQDETERAEALLYLVESIDKM